MGQIGRLLTAMITPFDAGGQVDYQQARRLAMALVESGSDGLVVSGTTGESPTLTSAEKLRLWSEVKSAVGDGAAVVAGSGSYSTHESIEVTREAERIGVDAAMLVVPYYNKPTQEGLYQHFKAIAESTNLPCLLYNVPSRTITNMAAETALRLSHVPNIIGVKEASGDFDQIARIIAGAPQDFLVWSGNDSDTFGLMSLGGYGIISVASHIIGSQIKEMISLLVAGRTEEAAEQHRRMLPFFKGIFVVSNPIPIKYLVNRAGFKAGTPRLPLVEPEAKVSEFLDDLMSRYKVDLPVGVA